MAFKRFPIRSKTLRDNTKLIQVNPRTDLGCKIPDEEEKDITSKISRFLKMLVILNYALKPNSVQKQS